MVLGVSNEVDLPLISLGVSGHCGQRCRYMSRSDLLCVNIGFPGLLHQRDGGS